MYFSPNSLLWGFLLEKKAVCTGWRALAQVGVAWAWLGRGLGVAWAWRGHGLGRGVGVSVFSRFVFSWLILFCLILSAFDFMACMEMNGNDFLVAACVFDSYGSEIA